MKERRTSRRGWRRLGQASAVAATALPAVGASAVGVGEGSFGGDFSDSLLDPSVLPAGTTSVSGSGNLKDIPVFDQDGNIIFFDSFPDTDFVLFDDLLPGATFSIVLTSFFADFGSSLGFWEVTATGPERLLGVGAFAASGETATTSGIVPLSGELIAQISPGEDSHTYSFTIDAPRTVVPEPAAGSLLALGLAGVAGAQRLRRRRPDTGA